MTTFKINQKEYSIKDPKPEKTSRLDEDIKMIQENIKNAGYAKIGKGISGVDPRKAMKIVKKFIKENQRILFGGTALNMLLPKDEKIYSRSELPDYDFKSTEPWKDAKKLADLLYEGGYKYSDARGLIHKGSYRVYADFFPVADIGYLPEEKYKNLPTRKKNGFVLVGPEYHQRDMNKIASLPLENSARWPKVSFRQKLLEKWTPPKFKKKICTQDFIHKEKSVYIDPKIEKILLKINKFAAKNNLMYCGGLAYNKYLEIGDAEYRIPVYYYEFLAENAGELAKKLKETIENKITIEKIYFPYKDINNTSYNLRLEIDGKEYPLTIITELTRCTSYKYIGKRYYCSIDYLFFELYYQLINESRKEYKNNLGCLIRYLRYIQQNYYKKERITEFDDSPFQRFVTKCKGPYVNLVRDTLFERFVDKMQRQEELLDVYPEERNVEIKDVKDKKIRIYPEKYYQPTECKNIQEQDCYYPCEWNENIGKCIGIPPGGYQPIMPKVKSKTIK